jgi:hypothetical protein
LILLSRLIAALAYAGAAFFLGMSLGERGELGIVQHVFSFVVPLTTLVLVVFTKQGRAQVALTGLAMFAGVYLGQQQFARAWDECTTRGHVVRDALVRYHAENDGYPARLEDLEIDIPCRAGFRSTILHYLSNERGYRLWITNDRTAISFGARPSSSGRSSTPAGRRRPSTPGG